MADINIFMNENNWFDLEEFQEFVKNQDKYLTENVSAQTRVKLANAARRTAKRRAVVSRLKKGKPASNKTLKKRTYEQIKNSLRKRVSGKNWKSLSYSTRERIDKTLSRKSPQIKKIVKKVISSARIEDNKRLQRLKSNKK